MRSEDHFLALVIPDLDPRLDPDLDFASGRPQHRYFLPLWRHPLLCPVWGAAAAAAVNGGPVNAEVLGQGRRSG
jgi:hypothetical protein